MSTLMNLKVTKVAGGSAGQLIVFSLVGADANTLAARLQKERGDSVLELFVKNPDHGFVEGQELVLILTTTAVTPGTVGTTGGTAFSVKTNRSAPAPASTKTQPLIVSSTAKPVAATGVPVTTTAPATGGSTPSAPVPTEHERLVKAEGRLKTLSEEAADAAKEAAAAETSASAPAVTAPSSPSATTTPSPVALTSTQPVATPTPSPATNTSAPETPAPAAS